LAITSFSGIRRLRRANAERPHSAFGQTNVKPTEERLGVIVAAMTGTRRQRRRSRLDAAGRAAHHPAMIPPKNDSAASLEEAILSLCNESGAQRTICPTDAAKAYAQARGEDHLGWRSHLSDVRRVAVRLADAGRLVVYRKGKPADPHDFRGVYRLGLPRVD
jgi:hypothetical protein